MVSKLVFDTKHYIKTTLETISKEQKMQCIGSNSESKQNSMNSTMLLDRKINIFIYMVNPIMKRVFLSSLNQCFLHLRINFHDILIVRSAKSESAYVTTATKLSSTLATTSKNLTKWSGTTKRERESKLWLYQSSWTPYIAHVLLLELSMNLMKSEYFKIYKVSTAYLIWVR